MAASVSFDVSKPKTVIGAGKLSKPIRRIVTLGSRNSRQCIASGGASKPKQTSCHEPQGILTMLVNQSQIGNQRAEVCQTVKLKSGHISVSTRNSNPGSISEPMFLRKNRIKIVNQSLIANHGSGVCHCVRANQTFAACHLKTVNHSDISCHLDEVIQMVVAHQYRKSNQLV